MITGIGLAARIHAILGPTITRGMPPGSGDDPSPSLLSANAFYTPHKSQLSPFTGATSEILSYPSICPNLGARLIPPRQSTKAGGMHLFGPSIVSSSFTATWSLGHLHRQQQENNAILSQTMTRRGKKHFDEHTIGV